MTEKRFENRLNKKNIKFNTLNPVWDNEKGIGLNVFEMIDELNELHENTKQLKGFENLARDYNLTLDSLHNTFEELLEENEQLKSENEKYRNMFFEIVETTLTDKNCRELYCKGVLDIFDKANSLNQARDMIKEHLE